MPKLAPKRARALTRWTPLFCSLSLCAGSYASGCAPYCDVTVGGEELAVCAERPDTLEPTPTPEADSADTDGDTLDAAQERALGTDPKAADSDADGLEDDEERSLGTDPRDPDTDDDGLADGDEQLGLLQTASCQGRLDPLSADTDQDGLSDGEEFSRGTCPSRADTDGDGDSDGEELSCGSSPLDPFLTCTS